MVECCLLSVVPSEPGNEAGLEPLSWLGSEYLMASKSINVPIVLQPNSDLGVDLASESTQCFFDVYDTLVSTYTESG